MRKVISSFLLAIFCITISFSALAEIKPILFDLSKQDNINIIDGSFSIRGGVQFGMNFEEVKNIDEADYVTDASTSSNYSFVVGYGGLDSLAGIPILSVSYPSSSADAPSNPENLVKYYFDDNGKLKEIGYFFGYSGINSRKNYDELYRNLANKYGSPLPMMGNEYFSDCSEALQNTLRNYEKSNSWNNGWFSISQWIVKYNDYYVNIDLILNMDDSIRIGYKQISFEEMERIVNEAETIIQNKNEEITNDL